jgi:Fe-S-cluster containining protein
MLIKIQSDHPSESANQALAPQLKACRECSASKVCCSVAKSGGEIESPYLLPTDVSLISQTLGILPEEFVEVRPNSVTGHSVTFVKSSGSSGCRFHSQSSGHCEIYNVRPLDCRLYPLDIVRLNGTYFWILWEYCTITEADLSALLSFGRQILPLSADDLADYATVPLNSMSKTPYRIIAPLSLGGACP